MTESLDIRRTVLPLQQTVERTPLPETLLNIDLMRAPTSQSDTSQQPDLNRRVTAAFAATAKYWM